MKLGTHKWWEYAVRVCDRNLSKPAAVKCDCAKSLLTPEMMATSQHRGGSGPHLPSRDAAKDKAKPVLSAIPPEIDSQIFAIQACAYLSGASHFRFSRRHSHGGTGLGSAHKPKLPPLIATRS